MESDRPGIKATERSFHILETVRSEPGASLGELARTVDVSKSAVYKHVQSLLELGYLVREDAGYYLSARFLTLGFGARPWLGRPALRDVIANLAASAGHTASFVVAEPESGVYALRSGQSANGGDAVVPGQAAPFHASAGGKAVFAFLPSARREELLEDGEFPAYTDKTMTSGDVLKDALVGIRDRRVAFDREEHFEGRQAVAVPVIGPDGDPVGAVSVSGATAQLSGKRLEEDAVGLVTGAAKAIENDLLAA